MSLVQKVAEILGSGPLSPFFSSTRGDKAACACILEAETLLSSYRMSGRRRSEERSESAPGTPSPGRRRTPSPHSSGDKPRRPPVSRVTSMPDIKPLDWNTQFLIQDQLARKKKLELELDKDKIRLQNMKEQAKSLEEEMEAYTAKVRMLREEIKVLQIECNRLTIEVDNESGSSPVPLGETDEEFYKNIYTGQRGTFRMNTSRHRERWRQEEEGAHWRCHMCTFQNHPLLDKCEQCNMPRIIPDGGETQNIHIHVTHHNYPSCKVVHSWVI